MTALLPAPSAGRCLRGHLHLTAAPDESGRTFLSRQSFRAPVHLSKPHTDAGWLVVNIVNPTAGLFDGDEIDIRAVVEPGARLTLTTPSAGRIYRSRSGAPAIVRQSLTVASGGTAEYFPELLIPQAGARYHQHTTLHCHEGGRLLFAEWLAPGRVAGGESFAWDELLWQTDATCAGRLIARERFRLSPRDASLTALTTLWPASHCLGFFVLGWPAWPAEALDSLDALEPGIALGHGPLAAGGHLIRALCRDSLAARRTFHRIRDLLHAAAGHPAPALRRF